MLFNRQMDRELKMVWEIEKAGKTSFLVGTAHFFPHSFRKSLSLLFRNARHALFEGPLDEENMAKVVEAGMSADSPNLLERLDRATVGKVASALFPHCKDNNSMALVSLVTTGAQHPVLELVRGMKPWLAFFTLFSAYLKRNGWTNSVDREAFLLAGEMGKNVSFLETIDEQIEVLESLSVDQIVDFIKRIDRWNQFTKKFGKWYLDGDVESIKSNVFGFPTRHPSVIDRRDEIFFERMKPYLQKGDSVFCVGVPHIVNLRNMLKAEGYQVRRFTVTEKSVIGYVFRGPEGLCIWCAKWGHEEKERAVQIFPWWGKVRPIGTENLEDFAPSWPHRKTPSFLLKEMNTGRVVGAIE